ncbi:MAG: rhodanese-like domain-containing protein [Anaerovoracaceae bacterium]
MKEKLSKTTALILLMGMFFVIFAAGCGAEPEQEDESGGQNTAMSSVEDGYHRISAEEAKSVMDENTDAVILDVREQDEYDSGHIPGAVLLPVNSIDETRAAQVIPTKDTTVLVYCRSGNRSRTASARLVGLGYTQVYEFGGIRDWPYETE